MGAKTMREKIPRSFWTDLTEATMKLEAIYSKAMKLVQTHFHGIEQYPKEFRIAILAYMKMIIALMEMGKEVESIEEG